MQTFRWAQESDGELLSPILFAVVCNDHWRRLPPLVQAQVRQAVQDDDELALAKAIRRVREQLEMLEIA